MQKLKNYLSKIKNSINKLKNKTKKTEQEEKEKLDINKLPEKINNLNLENIITFWLIFRVGLAILFIVYLWYIGAQSLDIIYAIFTAFIISIAIESLITFLSRFIPRNLSIILAYIILFIFLTLGFIILIPFIISNSSQIINIILSKITTIQNQIQTQSLQDFINSLHIYPYIKEKLLAYTNNPNIANNLKNMLSTNISNILQTMAQSLKSISWWAIDAVSTFFNTISQVLIIFTLAIFFSFEKEKVVYTIATLSRTPKKTAIKLKKLYFQLWEWLKWQLILSLFIWISVYLWLRTLAIFWINLESKWTLALIAGLMEFLPYLWPILGALPALLVGSISYGFTGFLWVWILFIIIQQIEWLIVPIIMNKALGVSPLLILICMLFWLKILGIIWVILAIPLAVIISLLFEEKLGKN